MARNRGADQFVGEPASAGLQDQLKQRSEGSYTGRTLEGVDVIGCLSRSSTYGWTVAIGVPEPVFAAELRRTLVLYAAAGLGLLALGLVLANVIGRRIAEPIQALVAPAWAIGRGEMALIEPSKLREAADLGAALTDAQALPRQRALAREQAVTSLRDSQSRLRLVLDVSRIGD